MRNYHKLQHDPAPCALELISRGANVVRGRAFELNEKIYYKVTRDNLLAIAGKYREMISDTAEI